MEDKDGEIALLEMLLMSADTDRDVLIEALEKKSEECQKYIFALSKIESIVKPEPSMNGNFFWDLGKHRTQQIYELAYRALEDLYKEDANGQAGKL